MQNAADILRLKGGEIISVGVEATIADALELMIEHKVGATLIAQDGRYVGIWTERDLMRQALAPGFDPRAAKIRDHMVTGLRTAPHGDTAYQLMDKFLGLRLRHLLVEKDGEFIGVLSVGDVIKTCLQEKTHELQDLHAVVSWEYYEEWRSRPAPD
jgi:CBS domain-containing protein